MPIYVIFASFLESVKTAAENNHRQLSEINERLQTMGAKVINQYGQMGSYDVVDVIEVSDNVTVSEMEKVLPSNDVFRSTRVLGPYPFLPDNTNCS